MVEIEKMLMPDQEEVILTKAIERMDFISAAGERQSQKFEFKNIETDSFEWDLIVDGLIALIQHRYMPLKKEKEWPEALVTVATGADRLGDPLATELGIKHISTTKHPFDKERFDLNGPFEAGTRIVLVDDVYTRGTNLGRVGRAAAEAGLTIVGAAVICDRSYDHRPEFFYGSVKQGGVESLIKHPM